MNRSSPPRALRLAFVCVAFGLVATACGSSSGAADTSTETTVVDSQDESTTEDTTAEPTEAEDAGVEEPEVEAPETEEAEAGSTTEGADIGLFFDGALANEVATVDCTLSGGDASTCYEITVVGYPADYDIGPFCPETTAATAEEGGIWFDGDAQYDIDGEFILGLDELYGDSNWLLYDEDGNVNVTDTEEAFEGAARPDVAVEYQNHCVEGQIEWLDGGVPVPATVIIPTNPVAASSSSTTRGALGVTLSGVTIAVAAPVDAILGAYTIAAFDDCGGHINPFDGYHLHGATGCGEVAVDGHSAIFGYAVDGFAIHSPYGEDDAEYTDLDSCGGHTTDELGYHYHASPAAENAVITCLSGQTAG